MATPTNCFPVRRRRKSVVSRQEVISGEVEDLDGKSSTDKGRVSSVYLMEQAQFDASADAFMEKIYQALEPLRKLNEGMVLSRGIEEEAGKFIMIDLGPSMGQYNIQMYNSTQALLFESPISGQNHYMLSNNEWIGIDDGHNFEGLLVRDLIRQCHGVPKL